MIRKKKKFTDYLWLLRNTEQDVIGLLSHKFRDNTRYKDSENAVAKHGWYHLIRFVIKIK